MTYLQKAGEPKKSGRVQLIFYRPFARGIFKGPIWEKMIALFTLGKTSHVEIRWPGLGGKCFSSAPRTMGAETGCRFIHIEDRDLAEEWDVVDIPCSEAQSARLHQWCADQVGKRYDWLGIIGHGLLVLICLAAMAIFGLLWVCTGSPWDGLAVGGAMVTLGVALWVPGLIHNPDNWYCSEVCSQALKTARIIHFTKIRQSPAWMLYRVRLWKSSQD